MKQSKIKTIVAAFALALALGGLSLNAQAEVFDPEANTETQSVASNNSGSSCDYYGHVVRVSASKWGQTRYLCYFSEPSSSEIEIGP